MSNILNDSGKDLSRKLLDQVKEVAGSWPSFAALGSFVLYVSGYLALRFHFTVLGLGTDLAVLDERYLFAGAKFLVYVVSSRPIIVLLVLLLYVTAYVLGKGLLILFPQKAAIWWQNQCITSQQWWGRPNRLVWAGIIFSVMLIQFVMRKCFFLSNLLVSKEPTAPAWLLSLMIRNTWWRELYYPGLVAGTVLTGIFWWSAKTIEDQSIRSQQLTGLLQCFGAFKSCFFQSIMAC